MKVDLSSPLPQEHSFAVQTSPFTSKMLRPAIDVESLMEQLTLEEKVELSAGE